MMKAVVFAGSIVLAACASRAPVSPSAAPVASGAVAAAASPASPPPAKTKLHGYELVVRNGVEYYCRYEPVVGSHTERQEICLTKEQVAQGQKSVDEFTRQLQDQTVNPQSMNPGAHGK